MKPIALIVFLFFADCCLSAETSFIAINAETDEVIASIGPDINVRYSPCSTFKIALSLIGYELGILKNENEPIWPYDGSRVSFESQRAPQSPKTWMSLSVIWYSKILAEQINRGRLQSFLSQFCYGNQDLSGDGTKNDFKAAHLSSSLKISPHEQVHFLKKLVHEELPLSLHAMKLTKEILFERSISNWKLFGKTGAGFDSNDYLLAWYIGWLESADGKYIFALLMRNLDTLPSKEERQKTILNNFLIKEIFIDN
jgi:beta-lactamase class D